MAEPQKFVSLVKDGMDRGQEGNAGGQNSEDKLTNDEKEEKQTSADVNQEQTSPGLSRASNSDRVSGQQPQVSSRVAGPSHIVVAEEITVGVPLFRPKKEFLKILKNGGAESNFFTKKEIIRCLKEYIGKRRLYNPYDPSEVNCSQDELSEVFGVQKFTIADVLNLIHKNCYQLPDTCLKRRQVLVTRPLPRNHQETGAALSTQSTPVTGERSSPAVCVGQSGPTSIITSSIGPSTSGGASLHSTSTSPQGASREGQESRRQRRRSKRRPRPKRKQGRKNSSGAGQSGSQNQPGSSGSSECSDPLYIKVKVETDSDTDHTSNQQDGSSSQIEQSSDDLWFLEEDHQEASDTFSIEYELEDSEPSDIISESSSVVSGQDVIVVCSDSDVEFWADESDTCTDWNEGDQWTCACGTKNTPVQRHCIFCWKIRPGWLGEKRKYSPSSEEMDSNKKLKEDSETDTSDIGRVAERETLKSDSIDSGICLSSQDTASSQAELIQLGSRRISLNYRSKESPVKKGPEDPCIICLKRPKTGSIIHGGTGHQVCCYPCAKRLKRKKRKCPVCRRTIKNVIRNYVL
ncbi:E3 ubiquitin-protein ligase Mdm2-like isoform X1 [Saccostrea echinata]|uniref:E3 ubiquitin-protein ligase Mdm2-like isoform X1 n=1 Tax=Saccostrea echinata TaxID=191078 RepID=UPI002A80C80A|nr:E3 ubiquitin-protein ligase Mdm2-like isoform X1 [Saccostrea echinata]